MSTDVHRSVLRGESHSHLTRGLVTMLDTSVEFLQQDPYVDFVKAVANLVNDFANEKLSRVSGWSAPSRFPEWGLLVPTRYNPARTRGEEVTQALSDELDMLREATIKSAGDVLDNFRTAGGNVPIFGKEADPIVTALKYGLGTKEERQAWYNCLHDLRKKEVDSCYAVDSTDEDRGYKQQGVCVCACVCR